MACPPSVYCTHIGMTIWSAEGRKRLQRSRNSQKKSRKQAAVPQFGAPRFQINQGFGEITTSIEKLFELLSCWVVAVAVGVVVVVSLQFKQQTVSTKDISFGGVGGYFWGNYPKMTLFQVGYLLRFI